jgi:adhesin transport system membrane fusion protein
LTYLSSDTLVEQGQNGTTQVYYRAKILVKPLPSGRIATQNIKAGMTASADILSDKRSVLTYMIKPIARAFSGALGQK